MNRYLFIPAVAMIAMALSSFQVQPVQAGGCLHGKHHKFCCPKCDCDCSSCSLEAEVVDVEKKCYEVECKTICIPKVVFPWQKKKHASCHSCDSCNGRGCTNCVHNGARVRKVKVLKTKKYECPECKYTWTPDENSPCCGGSCSGGCGCGGANCDGGCCDAGCDSGMNYEVPQPVESYEQPAMPMYEDAGLQPAQQYDFAPVEVQTVH